jgi:carbon-monoxide dehydrogenase large subunit
MIDRDRSERRIESCRNGKLRGLGLNAYIEARGISALSNLVGILVRV